MPRYTLLLHESDNLFADLSPAEIQAIVARYSAWSEKLRNNGTLQGSQKLRDGTGRTMRRTNGRVIVTDGPYSEAKELIGGLFVIEADSYDTAVKIAEECPHLDFGTIEVREVEILR